MQCGIGASLDWGGCKQPVDHKRKQGTEHDVDPHGCGVYGCKKPEHRCTIAECWHNRGPE